MLLYPQKNQIILQILQEYQQIIILLFHTSLLKKLNPQLFQFQEIIQLMASRYIQKYPIPEGFPAVLKEFTRQILRDQPQNVIQYAAKYFQCLEKGQPFSYKSQFNVSKNDKQYELNFDQRKAEELVKKDVRINKISGAIDKKQMQKITQVIDIIYMKYDKNKNGLLEAHQLKVMLTELYKDGHIDKIPSDTEVNSYIAQMDKDKNGKIGKNQMTDFIRKTLN